MKTGVLVGAICFLLGAIGLALAQTAMRPDQFVATSWIWSKPQRVGLGIPAISGSTFTLDLAASQDFQVVLVHASCPCTINFTNPPTAPQRGVLEIKQSATGGDLVNAWGTSGPAVVAPGGVASIALTATASAKDLFSYAAAFDSDGNVLVNTAALNVKH